MKTETVFFGILVKPALDGLIEYYETSESLLESAKKGHLSRINEEVKRIAKETVLSKDEEYAEWVLRIQEHENTYDMLFANYFRYSFIVLVFLVFEDHLHRFCYALQDAKGYPKPPPKPKANIIKTYGNYILEVGVSVEPSLWEASNELNIIRNCIVHSSGDITHSHHHSDLLKISQKDIGINISHKAERTELTPLYLKDNMLMIESRYCKSVINDIKVLFDALCKAAQLPTSIRFEDNKFIFE